VDLEGYAVEMKRWAKLNMVGNMKTKNILFEKGFLWDKDSLIVRICFYYKCCHFGRIESRLVKP
jgi:hypothetical protein